MLHYWRRSKLSPLDSDCEKQTPSTAQDPAKSGQPCTKIQNQIEDYRPGYPQFSALVGAHDTFQIYRRFSNLRSRLLLYKQDSLSVLEKRLNDIDDNEKSPLFLGSRRRDKNEERKGIMGKVDLELAEYGKMAPSEIFIETPKIDL